MGSKKLSLQLESLKVETFTAGADESRTVGTVHGHDGSALLGTCFGTACAGSYGDQFDTCRGPSCLNCPSDSCLANPC